MTSTAVSITLSNIHCSDEGDGPGSAEPFLWTVFFKIDGDTVSADSGTLQGAATIVATPGNHGDLGTSSVAAGNDLPIPEALGRFTGFVEPIPGPGGVLVPGVVGYIATLLEQDSTPNHAIADGHVALNQAVESELNDLLPKLKLTDLDHLDDIMGPLKKRISDRVAAAVSRAQSTFEKLSNQDDTIGTDVKLIFAQDEQIGLDPTDRKPDPIAFKTTFNNEGSWTISGAAAVLPPEVAQNARKDVVVRKS